MGEMSEDMRAQMMKLIGMTDNKEFDNVFKEYAGSKEVENLKKKSAFGVQLVMMVGAVENLGMENFNKIDTVEGKLQYVTNILDKDPNFRDARKMFPTKKSEKSAERSKKMRDLGNKAFAKKYNRDAIRDFL